MGTGDIGTKQETSETINFIFVQLDIPSLWRMQRIIAQPNTLSGKQIICKFLTHNLLSIEFLFTKKYSKFKCIVDEITNSWRTGVYSNSPLYRFRLVAPIVSSPTLSYKWRTSNLFLQCSFNFIQLFKTLTFRAKWRINVSQSYFLFAQTNIEATKFKLENM